MPSLLLIYSSTLLLHQAIVVAASAPNMQRSIFLKNRSLMASQPAQRNEENAESSITVNTTCYDAPGWTDYYGFNCSFYSTFSPIHKYCDYIFTFVNPYGADEACCYCGGGFNTTISVNNNGTLLLHEDLVPSFAPTSSLAPTTSAVDRNQSQASKALEEYLANCIDFGHWHDRDGPMFDCYWYAQAEAAVPGTCYNFGDGYLNKGMTGNRACCACTNVTSSIYGGYQEKDVLVTVEPFDEPETGKCFDYYKWSVAANGWTCDDYIDDETMLPGTGTCEAKGHFVSLEDVSAKEACCVCGGGSVRYESRMLRVGIPEDSTDGFTLTTLQDGVIRNGTFNFFLNEATSGQGYGMVRRNISEEANDLYPDDSYIACAYDITLGNLDTCAGPFLNLMNLPINTSIPLYTIHYFLVVRQLETNFWHYLILPFNVFNIWSWGLILLVICVLSCTMDILHNGFSNNSDKVCRTRIGSALFNSITHFVGKKPVPPKTKGPEKVALLGFTIFTLFVLSTFTGAITESLIIEVKATEYNALSDVVLENGRLCMAAILHEQFIKEHPETADIIMSNYSSQSSYELLAALEDNSCDAIVLSSTEFVAAGRLDSEYCSSAAILRDNILFNVDIIIPFGGIDDHGNRYNTSSDRFGYDATIAHFNRMVKYRWFESFYDKDDKYVEETRPLPESCKGHAKEGSSQVNSRSVLLPALISIVCCAVALVCWWRKAQRDNDVVQKDEKVALVQTNSLELYKMLSRDVNVDRVQLERALECLPDRSELMQLARSAGISSNGDADRDTLRAIGMNELLNELIYYEDVEADEEISMGVDRAMESCDVKESLISLIMQNSKMKRTVLRNAQNDAGNGRVLLGDE